VTGGPLSAWHGFCRDFKKLATKMIASTSVNINSTSLRDEVKSVARHYMQEARFAIARNGFEEELKHLDEHFTKLYELADGRNAAASYKWRINSVKKALTKLTSRLEMEVASADDGPGQSAVEIEIVETLRGLVPTAALSYQQAIRDLADGTRLSYRGPAAELREVLREVLDHQAPDTEVIKSENYKPEKDQHGKDRSKPTMKQQVRFILKARGQGSSTTELPERAVEAIDSLVGGFARSVYNFGSVVTHVAGERQAVVNLKRYVEVVLTHLLEL
jgi:Predicted pPIWI-associating nuclease